MKNKRQTINSIKSWIWGFFALIFVGTYFFGGVALIITLFKNDSQPIGYIVYVVWLGLLVYYGFKIDATSDFNDNL